MGQIPGLAGGVAGALMIISPGATAAILSSSGVPTIQTESTAVWNSEGRAVPTCFWMQPVDVNDGCRVIIVLLGELPFSVTPQELRTRVPVPIFETLRGQSQLRGYLAKYTFRDIAPLLH